LPIFAVANAYREWRDLEDDEVEELLRRSGDSARGQIPEMS
jgi:predicted phosphoribosyltransferase